LANNDYLRYLILYFNPGKISIHKLGVYYITSSVRQLKDEIAIPGQLLFNLNRDLAMGIWRKYKAPGSINRYCSDLIWLGLDLK
jgi:hypothetical protein